MAHSIELLFDDDSDAAIRVMWQALDDAGLPSQLRVKSPTNRPHVTLLAARRISPDADEALCGIRSRLPVDAVIGAPLVFGGPRLTLARLVVPSAELLALHEAIYRLTLPHVMDDPYAHSTPGHWTPHATLGRRFSQAEIGMALATLNDREALSAERPARLVGLRRWDGDARVDHVLV